MVEPGETKSNKIARIGFAVILLTFSLWILFITIKG